MIFGAEGDCDVTIVDTDYDAKWIERAKANSTINSSGCWIWNGLCATSGYGALRYRSKSVSLHRQIFKLLVRQDLKAHEYVCHSCDKKRCWNPEHLWIGTNSDNQLDAVRKKRHHETKKTHCPRGHEYDSENTLWVRRKSRAGRLGRHCKACIRLRTTIQRLCDRTEVAR